MNHLAEISQGLHEIFPDKSAQEFRKHLLKGRRSKSRHFLVYPKRISYIEYKEVKRLPVFELSPNKGGLHVESSTNVKTVRFTRHAYIGGYVSRHSTRS